MKSINFLTILPLLLFFVGCEQSYTPEQQTYIDKVLLEREKVHDFMKNNTSSPFNRDKNVSFTSLKYFDVDPDFKFQNKLYEYYPKDTVTVLGTKGEKRIYVRYGYIPFRYDKKDLKVNVYQGKSKDGNIHYSIWFTDVTTGDETYGVGRYLNLEKEDNPDHIYTIDFNFAYNPYCAYTPIYSCAIPLEEDHIPIAIRAGEKNYH